MIASSESIVRADHATGVVTERASYPNLRVGLLTESLPLIFTCAWLMIKPGSCLSFSGVRSRSLDSTISICLASLFFWSHSLSSFKVGSSESYLGINPAFASIAGLLIGVFSLGLLFPESGNKGESLEAERWLLKGQVPSVLGFLLGRESMNTSARIINIPANAMG